MQNLYERENEQEWYEQEKEQEKVNRLAKGERLNGLIRGNRGKKKPLVMGERKKRSPILSAPQVSIAQAQQQHIHHVVSYQIEQQVALFENHNLFIEGMALHELKKALIGGYIAFQDGAQLTESELERNWHTWMGDIVTSTTDDERFEKVEFSRLLKKNVTTFSPSPDNRPTTVSPEAAAKLLNNPELFQQGLNPLQFDNGFVLVRTVPESPPILHYLPQAQKKKVLFSPKLPEKSQRFVLGIEVCETTIKKLSAPLQTLWKQVQYNKEQSLAFRHNLLKLAPFSSYQITALLDFCQQGDFFDFERLEFILAIYQKVNALAGNNTSSKNCFLNVSFGRTLERKGLQKEMEQVVNLCNILGNCSITNTTLHHKKQWALLELHSEYGENGITALHFLQENKIFQKFYPHFSSNESYLPMMKDFGRLKNALDIISCFEPKQQAWFIRLFEQHAAIVKNDDLPTLVESFVQFSNRITSYGLDFYDLAPHAFASVKNLPTALGNILSILRENRSAERGIQWACISEICLDSNAAVRALTDERGCEFILPEMRIEPGHYDEYYGYQQINHPKEIADGKSLEEVKAMFYRYLAHHPHRLPLSFYKAMEEEIHKSIKDFDTLKSNIEPIAQLYSILASSTTGEANSFIQGFDESAIAKTTETWKELLDSMLNFEIPLVLRPLYLFELRWKDCIDILFDYRSSPNLGVIKNIFDCEKLQVETLASMIEEHNSQVQNELTSVRRAFVDTFDSAIYKGLSFYQKSINKKKNVVEFYLNFYQKAILLAIGSNHKSDPNDKYENCYKNIDVHTKDFLNSVPTNYTNAFGELIGLMSHFRIDSASEKEIEALRTSLIDACGENNKRVVEGLALLQSMISVDSRWNTATLQNYIGRIAAEPDAKLSVLIAECFGKPHFSADFFDLCDNKTLPKITLKQIEKYFAQEHRLPVKNMLLKFGQDNFMHPDDNHLILHKLANLQQNLPAKTAESLFKFLTNPALYGSDPKNFKILLNRLSHSVNVSYFLYFAEKNMQKNTGWFTAKVNCFLELAEDLIRNYQGALSEKEILHLLSEKLRVTETNLNTASQHLPVFFNLLTSAIKNNALIKDKIIEFMEEFVKVYKDFDNALLTELVMLMDDMGGEVNLSLFSHLLEAEKPLDLQFLTSESYKKLHDKTLFWKIITELMNTNKLDPDLLGAFLEEFTNNQTKIAQLYETLPYPSLKEVRELLEGENFKEKLEQFNKNPWKKEPGNSFNLNDANDYCKKIKGIDLTRDLAALDSKIKAAESLNVNAIQEQLSSSSIDLPELIALTTRLLFLSAGKACNTIQYLELLGMLKAGSRIVAQIDTGEGKSRINMLLAACQHIKGTTVDFITKDMRLAERDYLGYKSFFNAIGAKSQLIFGNTAPKFYKKGGINFTTIGDLAHFRGAAHAQDGLDKVIDAPNNRTLIGDEADHLFYAMSQCQFNLSMANPSMAKLTFVYEEMIEFFYTKPFAVKWDADYCDQEFIDFVRAKDADQARLLESIPAEKRKLWQESAITSLEMRLNDKFTIQSTIQKETVEGLKIVSEATVLMNNRPDKGEFAAGVHQFLHARLNRLQTRGAVASLNPQDKELLEYFAKHPEAQPFLIEAEKHIYYSLTTKGVLDDYKNGRVYCSTATPGTSPLQEEAKLFYKIEKTLVFPPAIPSKRVTHPTYLTGNEKEQWRFILNEIRAAQLNNQPYLLICEDDTESAKINAYLLKNKIKHIKHLSAYTPKKEEVTHITKHAGIPGAVTITTSMHGRGTDIALGDASKEKGLKVCVTFLPKTLEDQKQLFGRAARFGHKGEAGYILNKQKEQARLNKTTFTDGFYFSADEYLTNQQAVREQQNQIQRILQFKVTDFQHQLQTYFYDEIYPNDSQGAKQPQWIDFHQRTVALGKECITEITENKNNNALKHTAFNNYLGKVAEDWLETFNCQLPQEVKLEWEFNFSQFLNPLADKKLQVPVVDKYHPAYDGRAVLYSRPFEKWRAVFRSERALFADFNAWLEGRGILFPNLRAWWEGAMTTDQLLFGCEDLSDFTVNTLKTIKIASLFMFCLFAGAGVGAALFLSGVFTPFGLGLLGFMVLIGVGAAIGLGGGAIVSFVNYCWGSAEPAVLELPANLPLNESTQVIGSKLGLIQKAEHQPREIAKGITVQSISKPATHGSSEQESNNLNDSLKLKI